MLKKPNCLHNKTWNMNYLFFIGWKQKDFERYLLDRFGLLKDLTSSDGFCIEIEESNDGFMVANLIWTREKRGHGAIAHECSHATTNTMSRAGWSHDYENEEPYCYLLEYIVNGAYDNDGVTEII